MYDENVLHYDFMVRTRAPRPEVLARRALRSQHMISFRLSDPEYDALGRLAKRAGLGRSALARRIVEHYVGEHGRRPGRR